MSKRNISKKVSNGTIVRTRDEHFAGQKNYRKQGYDKKGLYRSAVVVDSNDKNELALVKETTSNRAEIVVGDKKYRPHILTKDDKNKPIKEGPKFVIKRKKDGTVKNSIGKKNSNEIKKQSIKNSKHGNKNRNRLRNMKER